MHPSKHSFMHKLVKSRFSRLDACMKVSSAGRRRAALANLQYNHYTTGGNNGYCALWIIFCKQWLQQIARIGMIKRKVQIGLHKNYGLNPAFDKKSSKWVFKTAWMDHIYPFFLENTPTIKDNLVDDIKQHLCCTIKKNIKNLNAISFSLTVIQRPD